MGEPFRVQHETDSNQFLWRTLKKTAFGPFLLMCGVLDNVRTELMKSKVIPYVPNLLIWAQKRKEIYPTP